MKSFKSFTKNLKNPSRSPHKSFHRTYREELSDDPEAPGLLALTAETFTTIWRNKKLFFSLIFLSVVAIALFVGLLSESSVSVARETIDSSIDDISNGHSGNFARAGLLLLSTITTAGLNDSLTDGQGVVLVLMFIIIFLVSVYIVRFSLAGKAITFRDALYNSMTPFLSSLAIILVILAELIPMVILLIFLNAAIKTEFLSTPFYALLFLCFAALMILLSSYLISSSVTALVVVTAPGFYPKEALATSRELIFGRRIRLIIRLVFLILVVAFIFVIIMLPVILIDSWLKSFIDFLACVPVVSLFLLTTTCFVFEFASVYIYLYYRKMLNLDQESAKSHQKSSK